MSEQFNLPRPDINTTVSTVVTKDSLPSAEKPKIIKDQLNSVISPVVKDEKVVDATKSISVIKINNEPVTVEKLTIEGAAKEYLALLVDLGKDFTNPRAKTNNSPDGKKYSIPDVDSFIKKYGQEYEKQNYIISEVAALLDAEITWRNAGKAIRKINENISKIDEDTQTMGLIKRLFTSRERKQKKQQLQNEIGSLERCVCLANQKIGRVLEVNYSESGENSYYPKDLKTSASKNDELNARFFSEDRSQKIERAIELRTKVFEKGWHFKYWGDIVGPNSFGRLKTT